MKFKKPFFIAEISANHNGNFNNAIKLIKLAKNSGADAVKEVVKPMEEKKIELEQKMEETRKEVEVKTSFIRVGLTRMDEFRKHYPDEVIYGTGLLFAFPSFLREYERTPHFTFLLMMHR